MEVVDKGEFLVSNAEVKELIQDIRREATAGKYLRPKEAHIMSTKLQSYIDESTASNVKVKEVEAMYKILADFAPMDGQKGLQGTEMLNIVNLRPTSLVEMFAIIADAEVRFGDDKLNDLLDLVEQTLSAPPPPADDGEGAAGAAGAASKGE